MSDGMVGDGIVDDGIVDDAAVVGGFVVRVSGSGSQVSMWLDGVPVHGVGESAERAQEAFLDALEAYADEWVDGLGSSVNHAGNGPLVALVLAAGGDRAALRAAVLDRP